MSFKINQWESNITGPSRIVFCKTRDIMTKLLTMMMQKSRRIRSPLRSIEVKLLSANPQGSVTQNLTCHAHCSCPRRSFADPPEQMPFPATRSNIPVLEEWIKDYFKDSAFNQCKRQEWPPTNGNPMRIHTKPETIPYCCKKPTMVPLNFRAQVKKLISRRT